MENKKAFTLVHKQIVSKLETQCGVVNEHTALNMTHVFGKHKAIWDTGCAITTVHERIIEKLNLEIRGYMSVNTVIGTSETPYYYVDLLLPGGIALRSQKVLSGKMNACDVLIGMDIISLGDFAVTNLSGKTTFSFQLPSELVINFCDSGGNYVLTELSSDFS